MRLTLILLGCCLLIVLADWVRERLHAWVDRMNQRARERAKELK